MAARRGTPGIRRGAIRTAALSLVGLLLAGACAAPTAHHGNGSANRQVSQVLDRRAAAVLHHDEAAYLAALAPGTAGLRSAGRAEFTSLGAVPLSSWQYRVTDVTTTGDTATVRADLRYRITGYDRAPVSTPRLVRLRRVDGHWYVTQDRPGVGGAPQLWQQGRVEVVRGAHTLVLGVGQGRARLRMIAEVADGAVPAVDAVWPGSWQHRTVVYVPASSGAMAALLGRQNGAYGDIAAITTGETGGAGAAPADRIVVNPDAYGMLADFGQRVVLTHETTHVATRTATSAATPVWLSEGFADWIAYRGSGRAAGTIAPELRAAVQRGGPPAALPTDADFSFGANQDLLAQAYEEGWLACELIEQRWGVRGLTDFYRAVGAHRGRQGAVDDALRDVLSTTPAAFTALWQNHLRQRLGP